MNSAGITPFYAAVDKDMAPVTFLEKGGENPLQDLAYPASGTMQGWKSSTPFPKKRMNDRRLRQLQTNLSNSRNPYIAAATPIIDLILVIEQGAYPPDHHSIRALAENEIRCFHDRMKRASVSLLGLQVASYSLCSALDEAVLTSEWAIGSDWGADTLLWTFHNDSSGGDRFFRNIGSLLLEPTAQTDLLELLGLLLDLGFEGRHSVTPGGAQSLETIRDRLHEAVRINRPKPSGLLLTPAFRSDPRISVFGAALALAFLVAALSLTIFWNTAYRGIIESAEPLMMRMDQQLQSYEKLL